MSQPEKRSEKTFHVFLKLVGDQIRRTVFGADKYEKTMDRKDLTPSQWVVHHQEELMDALQYSERVREGLVLLEEARSFVGLLKRGTLTVEDLDGNISEFIRRYDELFGDSHNHKKLEDKAIASVSFS